MTFLTLLPVSMDVDFSAQQELSSLSLAVSRVTALCAIDLGASFRLLLCVFKFPDQLLVVSEGDVPRFLKVTVFEMHQKGILGESVTIIRPPVRPVYKWVRLDIVVCSVVAFRQPVNNTATLHESYRVAIPILSFS
eukprot:g56954.t1